MTWGNISDESLVTLLLRESQIPQGICSVAGSCTSADNST